MKANLHVTSKRLGNGTSASVYEATLDGTIPVAAKVGNYRDDSRRQIRREARRYSKLVHPNIIKCFAVTETASSVILITEYMAGGSLFHNLSDRKHNTNTAIPTASALQIAIYVVRALHHIHTQGFSCGDVKSLNILLSDKLRGDGYLETGCTIKFCDFGLSKRLYHDYDTSRNSSSSLDLWNSTAFDPDAKNIAGTFAYLAPECFERPPRTPEGMIAADVYALGVVLWELITGCIPWEGLSIGGLMRMMRENRKLSFDNPKDRKFAGGKLVNLVNKCWDNNPNKRPYTGEILETLQSIYHATEALSLVDSPTNVMQHAANVARSEAENASNSNGNGNIGNTAASPKNQNPEALHDSLTSDESTAIASINSDDEGFDADSSAFDISVSLYPTFAAELNRRKNMAAMRKARSDYSSSEDSDGDDRDFSDEEVAVFGNVEDIVVFDNPNKKKTFYRKRASYGRVPTIQEIPSEYQLPDTDEYNDNTGNTGNNNFNNYDRVPTIREIESAAILPRADSNSDSDGYSSDGSGSNYSSSIGDEDDINIGVRVEEEEFLDDYNHNSGMDIGKQVDVRRMSNRPSAADCDNTAHGSSSSAGSTVKNQKPPIHPNHYSHSAAAPKKQRKKKMAKDGCYIPEEFPAAGPGWLEATNELSEFEYTFQDKSVDSLPPPFPQLPVDLPRKPPVQQQNINVGEQARRSESAPLPEQPKHEKRRPASEQTTQPKQQMQPRRQETPPMVRRFYSEAPPSPAPSQVRRQYNVTPVVEHKSIEEELEMFEDLDANALVLGSVMQFSKFVQRNKT